MMLIVFLYVKRRVKRVDLNRNGSSQSGIYHCDIPTANTSHDGNESIVIHNTIYVGLYNTGGIHNNIKLCSVKKYLTAS